MSSDDVVGFLVNAVSISLTIFIMDNSSVDHHSFMFFALCMIIWVALDVLMGLLIFFLNHRLKLFHSDWIKQAEKRRENQALEESLRREFGIEDRGDPALSPQGIWRRP